MTQVLIVEDERPIARLIEMSLSRSGYACTVADDGLKAADLLDNEQVLGVEGSRFVTVRYVSDEPLDPNADPELYNARMQNATAEFGLLTFPTGERGGGAVPGAERPHGVPQRLSGRAGRGAVL